MPLVYRQRDASDPAWLASETLHIEADGVFAHVRRDARGTWRGRIALQWGYLRGGARLPAHESYPTISAPRAVGEGQIVAQTEREIRAFVGALQHASHRWWVAFPPNCPAPALTQ